MLHIKYLRVVCPKYYNLSKQDSIVSVSFAYVGGVMATDVKLKDLYRVDDDSGAAFLKVLMSGTSHIQSGKHGKLISWELVNIPFYGFDVDMLIYVMATKLYDLEKPIPFLYSSDPLQDF